MTTPTDQLDLDLARSSGFEPEMRGDRAWRSPQPVGDVPASAPRTASRLTAGVIAGALIASGAFAVSQLDDGPAPAPTADAPLGSMYAVADQVGARALWERGITGAGVNVAIIDTGVAPVEELSGEGKIRAAVDLSTEANDPATATIDSHGHGTHLAGIIAGRQPGADPARSGQHPEQFLGIAPDAGIVSVKVAGRDGDVAPGRVIAGIDWVVAHADELDIRVLAIAYDSGLRVPYTADPLAAAVERAWDAGIVVVAAAGNEGADANGLSSPAHDPYVIAVGGVDATEDGIAVAEWASSGDGRRQPDLAAPGAHIRSLRAPGSMADVEHPEGFVDDQLFLASGSSQSAAVAAGAAALMLSADPGLTNDRVKQAMTATAGFVSGATADRVGAGLLDVEAAIRYSGQVAAQEWTPAAAADPVAPNGSVPGFWNGSSWMGSSWMGSSWMGSSWMGSSWMGSSWMGSSWMGSSWMGSSWMGSSWMGSSWMGSSWMGSSWMGSSWMGSSWMGSSWMGSSWMGSSWMGSSWMGSSWM